jgi:copper(I)-binding protein
MSRHRSVVVSLAALALVAAACSGGKGIEVADAWTRSPMEDVGAVYFTVSNDGDSADALIGVSADVAGRAEIHETVMEGGQAQMRPVDSVEIPAGGEMSFEPGGYHVMLFELAEPLVEGDTISVTLAFEEAGEIEVDAEVRPFVEEEGGMDMGEDEGGM